MQTNTSEQSQEKSGSEHYSSQPSKSRSLSQPYKGSYSKHQFFDNSNSSQLSHVSYNELQLSIGSQSFEDFHSSNSNNFHLSNFHHPGSHLTDVSHPNIDDSKLSSVSLNNDDHDFGMGDAFIDCTPMSCHNLFYSSSLYE